MKLDQIKRLVQYYLDSSLEECEAARLDAQPNDDEQEALGFALTDALEDTQEQLVRNDFK